MATSISSGISGLYAPHWRSDARGLMRPDRFAIKAISRAPLWKPPPTKRARRSTHDPDSGVRMLELRADGGMVVNELLMQFQSDILGVPVVRPKVSETTALGAAYAAGSPSATGARQRNRGQLGAGQTLDACMDEALRQNSSRRGTKRESLPGWIA